MIPASRHRLRTALRFLLAAAMVAIGVDHFVNPASFEAIVPSFLPAPHALVLVSGLFEILGGLGLLLPQTRRFAAYGLIALFVAVFPANLNMAINHIQVGETAIPQALLWARLPFQALFIAWAWWFTRPEAPPELRPDPGP